MQLLGCQNRTKTSLKKRMTQSHKSSLFYKIVQKPHRLSESGQSRATAVIHSSHLMKQRGNERITRPREQGDMEIADLEKERENKRER